MPDAKTGSRGGIRLRKIVLGVILAGSIFFFFLILAAGAVAVMREGSPAGHSGLKALLVTGRRIIAHHIPHHHK